MRAIGSGACIREGGDDGDSVVSVLSVPLPGYYLYPMTAAILFDFNGVIIDDEPQHCDALIATLREYGYALDRETYYREYLGFDDRECFRFTFARMGRGVDEPALLEAIERKNRHYERAVRSSMRLVPGAE